MRRQRRRSLPQEPIILEIEKLSHEGRGIAHHEGKVVFVDQALPEETVEAQLTSRRERFSEAKTLQVLKASSDRVEPPCEYAGICGGCSLQHFDNQAQLSFKEGVLHELLSHAIDSDTYLHLPAIEGPELGYRRKARLAVRYVAKKEQVLIGFREKQSSFITNMNHCEVLDQQVSLLLKPLGKLIEQLSGYKLIPQIEVAVGDPHDMSPEIALVVRHLAPLKEEDKNHLIDFSETHKLAMYLQPGGMDTVHKIYPLNGPERLHYLLPEFKLTMAFHPQDFTQVNAEINKKMLNKAVELLELNTSDSVLDLFCGLGNFTLPLATKAGFVCGVEGSQEMVDRGYENASSNQLSNVEFHCADLFKPVEKAQWLKHGFNKVLLDPPRSGAIEMINNIVALKPERIVYVSCNPATLARDSAEFASKGYKLASAGVMDMFPHTSHVESIALFLPA